jgi:hypothetical protein
MKLIAVILDRYSGTKVSSDFDIFAYLQVQKFSTKVENIQKFLFEVLKPVIFKITLF